MLQFGNFTFYINTKTVALEIILSATTSVKSSISLWYAHHFSLMTLHSTGLCKNLHIHGRWRDNTQGISELMYKGINMVKITSVESIILNI